MKLNIHLEFQAIGRMASTKWVGYRQISMPGIPFTQPAVTLLIRSAMTSYVAGDVVAALCTRRKESLALLLDLRMLIRKG